MVLLMDVDYGDTTTYRDLAIEIGKKDASQPLPLQMGRMQFILFLVTEF